MKRLFADLMVVTVGFLAGMAVATSVNSLVFTVLIGCATVVLLIAVVITLWPKRH